MVKIKNIILVTTLLITISCGDSSGDPNGDPSDSIYYVIFDSCGGTSIPTMEIEHGALLNAPDNPGKPSYSFSGWYKEAGCTTVWNFSTDRVYSDITLYAKWTWRDSEVFVDDFTLAKWPSSSSYIGILYNSGFSGTINYIISYTDLGITDKAGFDASTDTKTEKIITADDDISNDYIKIGTVANRKHYAYILIQSTNELKVLAETTNLYLAADTSMQETVTVNGRKFKINFPAGYDASSPKTWPFVLSIMTPNFTYSDPNFPCITMNIGSFDVSNATIAALKTKIKEIMADTAKYKIDKSRLYATGFSTGGCAVILLAKDDGSSDYEFNAIVATGVNSWITSPIGTLATKNIWLLYGENDNVAGANSGGTVSTYNNIPRTSGDHFLTKLAGDDHDNSNWRTWQSPYTLRWLLSK